MYSLTSYSIPDDQSYDANITEHKRNKLSRVFLQLLRERLLVHVRPPRGTFSFHIQFSNNSKTTTLYSEHAHLLIPKFKQISYSVLGEFPQFSTCSFFTVLIKKCFQFVSTKKTEFINSFILSTFPSIKGRVLF